MSRISVIIPTLNCCDFLRWTLVGLVNQTIKKNFFEVIICDDGSTDNIQGIVDEFKHTLDILLVENAGFRERIRLSSTRNKGIKLAKYNVIVTLDADCIPSPNFLENHLKYYYSENREQISVIGLRKFVDNIDSGNISYEELSKFLSTQPEIYSISNAGRLSDRRLPEFEILHKGHPMPFNCFHTCNVSFFKEDAIKIGLFDEVFDENWGYEDIEFGYRLWKMGVRFIYAPEALVFHQENALYSIQDREKGKKINFDIACEKIPGFREFRIGLGR